MRAEIDLSLDVHVYSNGDEYSALLDSATSQVYEGKRVWVVGDEGDLCPINQHHLSVMDHYGHPTAWLLCYECFNVALHPSGHEPPCPWPDCWCRNPKEEQR